MHELAVTENILAIAQRHAQEADAARVTDLHLVIGQLASVLDDSVQFYWDIIAEGTLCAGARLHFERVPAQLVCRQCDQPYTLARELQPCPACGSANVTVISGEEFYLAAIEVEQHEAQVISSHALRQKELL
jgi:hydrogenase nickel incorporation protein HypA/HybF